jgi:ATP-dependent protease HslVU (ClpYQ) peptidase subunit
MRLAHEGVGMTVIAASVAEGRIAADRWCFDGDEHYPMKKLHRIRGMLVGFAGDIAAIERIRLWMRAGSIEADRPITGNATALILTRDRLCTWDVTNGLSVMERGWHAIGSGGACAQAAMLAGADVRRAVQITNGIHNFSGGGVSVYSFGCRS